MDTQEVDVLRTLLLEPFINQRNLAKRSGHSLEIVNRSLNNLIKTGYVDEYISPTNKARQELKHNSPKNAIILAAGVGMRMAPINTQIPKALVEVKGEKLIERIIKQLKEVGIETIYVVVGFLKEEFEYLIKAYGVELIVNEKYIEKNNFHSLFLAKAHLSNTYVIPADIWCAKNPFHCYELHSWYMVSDLFDNESTIRVNRKMELVTSSYGGNKPIGIAYLVGQESKIVREQLEKFDMNQNYNNAFWEETLFNRDKMIVQARVIHSIDVVEINTYEQLRELDDKSSHLKSDVISIIADTLKVSEKEIVNIEVLKKGMTNHSFLFTCRNKKYIMRIPGEGTEQLINRKKEAQVYQVIKDKKICDDIVYMNPENGYKITAYIEGARVCDPENEDDLKMCMDKLKEFHTNKLKVNYTFDIFGQMEFYETLWKEKISIYKDYKKTKRNVLSLKKIIDGMEKDWCLTHMDAIPDNFLIMGTEVRLIDWEYAGMQDPHVDIAMFCIYSLYDRNRVDKLIDIYFGGKCVKEIRIKIYCYIAVCGLLWSNWCEYKRNLGIEFGEYALHQYSYAKEYYQIVMKEFNDESRQCNNNGGRNCK